MDYFAKYLGRVFGLLLLCWSGVASAYYIDAEPPAGWRPGSEYSDGYARIFIGKVGGGGALPTGGAPAMYVSPLDVFIHPMRAQKERIYSDPVLDWFWRNSPGSEAQAFVPAAIYGPGAVVTTIVRTGAARASLNAFLKFAPNAGRDAARQGFRGAAAGLFMSMVAAAGLAWIWDDVTGQWMNPGEGELSDGNLYWITGSNSKFASEMAACRAQVRAWGGRGGSVKIYWGNTRVCEFEMPREGGGWYIVAHGIQSSASSCPIGWYMTPAGCLASINNRPLTLTEFEDGLQGQPWPNELPPQLPDGVPVESPTINPQPSPWDKPAPYFQPTGDPVPNPKFDPTQAPGPGNEPYVQPGRRIIGSPTPGSPWRVDVTPVDRPKPDPTPEPDGSPMPDPSKPPADPASAPPAPGKPDQEKPPLLCDVFPNISACQPLDQVADQPLETKTIDVAVTPDSGWGGGGSCPEPRHLTVAGWDVPIPFDLFCSFMEGIRPILLAMAWLGAAFTLVGAVRGSES